MKQSRTLIIKGKETNKFKPFFISTPIGIIILFITLGLLYNDADSIVMTFFFCVFSILFTMVLFGMIPFANIILLYFTLFFYNFTLDFVNLEHDAFRFIFFISSEILFIILNLIVYTSTLMIFISKKTGRLTRISETFFDKFSLKKFNEEDVERIKMLFYLLSLIGILLATLIIIYIIFISF